MPRCGARAIRKSKPYKLAVPRRFLNFKAPKFAPRCGARATWKSEPLKHQGPGPLFEFQAGFSFGSGKDFDRASA